jgi:adenylate cyclase
VVVLETAIRDFAALEARLGPSHMMGLRNLYFERIVPIATQHGGVVDKYLGGMILASFGTATSLREQAQAAVYAMLKVVEAFAAFSESRQREGREPLYLGVGVDVVDALPNEPGRRPDYRLAPDSASRLDPLLGAGARLGWDVFVSETVYGLVRDVIDVGEPMPVDHERMMAYPVLGPKGAVPRERRRAYYALLARQEEGPEALASR